ncbi:MAG TPA: amidohydrolase family protein [Bryobacteraceae bacterium]|nr:amidohydrolase family protein [Bryobacteraceae bacterium]
MIIDFHAHVGSMDSIGARLTADAMLHAMDAAGVDRCCVFNIFHADAAFGNDLTARFVAAHPDRFIGFAFVTPHYPEEMEGELARVFDHLGLQGIKIYPPYFDRTVEDAIWEPVFAFAHARKVPLISHSDGRDPLVNPNHGEPQMFVRWAEKYPDARIVLGHAGNFRSGRLSSIAAARRCANIFIEICTSWREIGSIEELVSGAGADRLLFGSDLPLMDPRIHKGRVLTAAIPETAKAQILGGNAARLLGLAA